MKQFLKYFVSNNGVGLKLFKDGESYLVKVYILFFKLLFSSLMCNMDFGLLQNIITLA